MAEPAVSVVIPARDAAATLPGALRGLEAQVGDVAFEVVVVDDGSADSTVSLASASPVVSQVVRLRDAGPGAARNAGAAAARASVLAFLDADCVPSPGWLSAGSAALRDADLVQGRVDPDPSGEADRTPFDRTLSVTAAWGLFESANLFVTRELYERLGGFPPGIKAPAERLGSVELRAKDLAEDVYFGWAARRAGARTAFCAEALVHHAVFRQEPGAHVAERLRARHFPRIVGEVPELRDAFLTHRFFLTRQTRDFDAAVAGVAAAALARSPLPLAAALPYALRIRRLARQWPQFPPARVVSATVAADAVTLASLVRGSLAARTVVL